MTDSPGPADACHFAAAAGFPSPAADLPPDPAAGAWLAEAEALTEETGHAVTAVPGGFLVAGLTVSSPDAVRAVAKWSS